MQRGKFRVASHLDEVYATFWCPACIEPHTIKIQGKGSWEFNGDFDNPTITPSILVHSDNNCHSYITNGQIQFLHDCKHSLKGQTVAIPDLPDWLKD